MKAKLDTVITVTLVVCALVTTGVVLWRGFFASPSTSAPPEKQPTFIKDWRSDIGKGVRMGAAAAPVSLIEFADFECPFCATFHKTLNNLRERYPREVSIEFFHFPLSMHRFAIPAARVAECAGEQGRFEAMYDQLFDGQDSFGLKPWSDYATAARVPDLAAFDACVKKTDPVPRIEAGKQLGAKLGVKGTPTLMVNGWLLSQPPTENELDMMVKAILSGKSPVASDQKL